MEEEHEVYGGDIPDEVEGELEGDSDGEGEDVLLKGDIGIDEDASKVSSSRCVRRVLFHSRASFGICAVFMLVLNCMISREYFSAWSSKSRV